MTAVYILCGGQSIRMGAFKPLVEWHGKPLLNYVIQTVQTLDLPIFLVSKFHHQEPLSIFNLPIIVDSQTNNHPLSAVVSALEHSSKFQSIICLPCDTPLISLNTLTKLLSSCPGTLEDKNGYSHPLISHISLAQLPTAKTLLEKQSSMREFAESFMRVTVSKEELIKFNLPIDLQRPFP